MKGQCGDSEVDRSRYSGNTGQGAGCSALARAGEVAAQAPGDGEVGPGGHGTLFGFIPN